MLDVRLPDDVGIWSVHTELYFVRKLNCIDMPSHHMRKTTTSHKTRCSAEFVSRCIGSCNKSLSKQHAA